MNMQIELAWGDASLAAGPQATPVPLPRGLCVRYDRGPTPWIWIRPDDWAPASEAEGDWGLPLLLGHVMPLDSHREYQARAPSSCDGTDTLLSTITTPTAAAGALACVCTISDRPLQEIPGIQRLEGAVVLTDATAITTFLDLPVHFTARSTLHVLVKSLTGGATAVLTQTAYCASLYAATAMGGMSTAAMTGGGNRAAALFGRTANYSARDNGIAHSGSASCVFEASSADRLVYRLTGGGTAGTITIGWALRGEVRGG